jgi:hypothetical protein
MELFAKRLEELRVMNDRVGLSDVETAVIRGRIDEIKVWVAKERPEQKAPDDDSVTI